MVKKINKTVAYTCFECNCIPFRQGYVRGEKALCECTDGYWLWTGRTWKWVHESVIEDFFRRPFIL